MDQQFFRKHILPFVGAVLIFVAFCFLFFLPVFQGKILVQGDIINYMGMSKESADYDKATGHAPLWTNSMFGGMPTYQIYSPDTGNLFDKIMPWISLYLPHPASLAFTAFIMFFILLRSFRVNYWIAIAGGIVYGIGTYVITFIEAGHNSKINAMALIPLVLTGINYLFRDRLWFGIALTLLGMSLELAANHPQITYYMFMIIACWMVSEFVSAIRNKTLIRFFKYAGIIVIITLLSVTATATRLWTTYEYGNESIRGGNILSESAVAQPSQTSQTETDGLDRDYVFQWSYGIGESFTLLYPNFSGGGSGQSFLEKEDSKTLSYLRSVAQSDQNAAQQLQQLTSKYWGELPFTSGPVYIGAVTCFLFLMGTMMLRPNLKWWLIAATVLSLFLGWGKHFSAFNYLLFDYFPLYDKFRTVMMALIILCITMPLLGLIALDRTTKINTGISDKRKINALKWSFIAIALLSLLMLIPQSFFDLTGLNEEQVLQQYGTDRRITALTDALKEDRVLMIRSDVLRTLFFVSLTAGFIWLYLKKKVSWKIATAVILIAAIADLWLIDAKYLDKENYGEKDQYQKHFAEYKLQNKIDISDKDPNFRVFNTTIRLDQDGTTPYLYKSIGGYHGAKLQRYQDVIDGHLTKGNRNVLNMLNAKYIITSPTQNNAAKQPIVIPNKMACGNAWFVDSIRFVATPDEEFKSLENFNPKTTAIVHEEFNEQIKSNVVARDSAATVKLTKYTPDELTYQYTSSTNAPIIFSEIWYRGNDDWKAYIDGKYTPHFRANYILRGLWAPPGNHEIVFRFEPRSYYTGKKISAASSSILLIVILVGFFITARQYIKEYKNSSAIQRK